MGVSLIVTAREPRSIGHLPADQLIGGLTGTAPKKSPRPRLQLTVVERLYQVIVRPEIQGIDTVVDL